MQQVPTADLDLAIRKKVVYAGGVGLLVITLMGLAWTTLV
jgi:hypothetical protein